MNTKAFPLSRRRDLLTRELENEILIYDLEVNKAFSLNHTSSAVWLACDGKRNISQITESVSAELNTPATEDLIWFTIDELKKLNLIENGEQINSIFNGVSRREVIKKVGLGTMVALPVIAALTAPSAANASSVPAGFGEPCVYTSAPGGVTDNCRQDTGMQLVCCGPVGASFCFDLADGDCGATN